MGPALVCVSIPAGHHKEPEPDENRPHSSLPDTGPNFGRRGIRGAIYHYIDSKADLYAAVYCDTIDHVYTEFELAAAEESDLLAQYGAVLRRAQVLQTDDPSITGFIVAVAQETQRHPDLLARLAPQRGRHTRFFARLVEEAAARGELQPDVDLRALADLLGSVLTGLARMAASAGDTARYSAAVDVLVRFIDGSLLVESDARRPTR